MAHSTLMGGSLNLPGAFARKIQLFLYSPLNSLINIIIPASTPESDKSRDTGEETGTAWEAISWKGTLASLHPFNWPCPGVGPRSHPIPHAQAAADLPPPQKKSRQDQKAHATDNSTPGLLQREGGGKVDGFPCRGLRCWHRRGLGSGVRGEGENGEGELLPSAMRPLASAPTSP